MTESPRFLLIGTPFSTFTRTVAMALHVKQLPFEHDISPPHSTGALHHPLGFVPVLYDRSVTPPLRLTEAIAILHYLDRIHPEPKLFDSTKGTPERIHELSSFAATHLFPAVEAGVVKPRLRQMDDGAEEEATIKSGLVALKPVLHALESMIGGPYAAGLTVSAADLFLWPILADLASIPEGKILGGYFMMCAWMAFFRETEWAEATKQGTLEVGGRP